MEFVKMHGLGNDFVVVEGDSPPDASDIARWCDRRRGIGADGVLRVTPTGGDTAIRMEYWNSDGSVAEMCGNGLRCAARYGYDQGWALSPSFDVSTAMGVRRADIVGVGRVRVELGEVTVGDRVTIGASGYRCAAVGNPHAVRFVDDVTAAPVLVDGPAVETDPAFPNGTNVEFVAIAGDGIAVRVWERGVGETQACGTGAAAAVAVAHADGLVPADVDVLLPGGTLRVEIVDGRAWITGGAEYVFAGQTTDRLT